MQDALSFRVVPQVHGALREYVAAVRNAVTIELNSADDNPLVSVPDQSMISNGNFHPMVLAIACDALRIALAQVGQLSERRMARARMPSSCNFRMTCNSSVSTHAVLPNRRKQSCA